MQGARRRLATDPAVEGVPAGQPHTLDDTRGHRPRERDERVGSDATTGGPVKSPPSARVPGISWGTLAIVATFAALAALWVALTPAGEQTELASRTWDQFAQQDQEVASIYSMDLAVLGLLGAGFGLLAGLISLIPYRRGERWAWYALWFFPITIGAVAARMLVDQYWTGYFYAGLAAVAVVGLVLPVRAFLRPGN
jgi:hypothetical protein